MPAQAGIQEYENSNNFKDLDSRFRGSDGLFFHCATVSEGEGKGGGDHDLQSQTFLFRPPQPIPFPRLERMGFRMETHPTLAGGIRRLPRVGYGILSDFRHILKPCQSPSDSAPEILPDDSLALHLFSFSVHFNSSAE